MEIFQSREGCAMARKMLHGLFLISDDGFIITVTGGGEDLWLFGEIFLH